MSHPWGLLGEFVWMPTREILCIHKSVTCGEISGYVLPLTYLLELALLWTHVHLSVIRNTYWVSGIPSINFFFSEH
jgi:uncharacterized metal-binding protein